MRTLHGRLLLRPSARANDLIVGVVGRAQRIYSVEIHGLVVLSNHLHLLLSPRSPQQLAAFMNYVAGNIGREIGRLHDWREKFWSRRYRAILVSHEEEAQAGRLAYLLAHGTKEGLVERPHHWPGVHCARALCLGTELHGTWFDRTAQYEARRRGESRSPLDFGSPERVVFSPLPCWAGLEPEAYRQRIKELVRAAVEQGRRLHDGRKVLGRKAIVSQDPHAEPLTHDRSPAPAVHAATKAIRKTLRAAYLQFVTAYREAAQQLRLGDRLARFPDGAFPPPMPCGVLGH